MILKCLACNQGRAGDNATPMVLICRSGSQYAAVCPQCDARPVYVEMGGGGNGMIVFETEEDYRDYRASQPCKTCGSQYLLMDSAGAESHRTSMIRDGRGMCLPCPTCNKK